MTMEQALDLAAHRLAAQATNLVTLAHRIAEAGAGQQASPHLASPSAGASPPSHRRSLDASLGIVRETLALLALDPR